MRMSDNDFNLLKYLMYCVNHFNERSTNYENCHFDITPVRQIINDKIVGVEVIYGNDIIKSKKYLCFWNVKWMKDSDVLLSWFEDKAKMVAKETYKKTGI